MQLYLRNAEIPETTTKRHPNYTPITPPSIPICHLRKKKGAKEMELATTMARWDTTLAIATSRKETRTRIEIEEMGEEEEQKEEADPTVPTTPRKNQTTPSKLPIAPTMLDPPVVETEPTKPMSQSMATKRKPYSIQEPWEII